LRGDRLLKTSGVRKETVKNAHKAAADFFEDAFKLFQSAAKMHAERAGDLDDPKLVGESWELSGNARLSATNAIKSALEARKLAGEEIDRHTASASSIVARQAYIAFLKADAAYQKANEEQLAEKVSEKAQAIKSTFESSFLQQTSKFPAFTDGTSDIAANNQNTNLNLRTNQNIDHTSPHPVNLYRNSLSDPHNLFFVTVMALFMFICAVVKRFCLKRRQGVEVIGEEKKLTLGNKERTYHYKLNIYASPSQ